MKKFAKIYLIEAKYFIMTIKNNCKIIIQKI